jgi:hypothetical protein
MLAMSTLPDSWRKQLEELRSSLLKLHKALVDNEKACHEAEHGPIASSGQYLQLLINDPKFTWLQPYTKLVVAVDIVLDSKEAVTAKEVDDLWDEARALTHGQINDEQSMYQKAHSASAIVQDHHAIVMAILSEAREWQARSAG